MSSENAIAVAREVSENIRQGKRVILGKIIAKRYAKSVALHPTTVTNTKSYQKTMKPIINEYQKLQNRLISELNRKSRKYTKEKLISLTTALKNTTHDLQLLSGGKTEDLGLEKLSNQINELITNVKANR